MGYNFSSKEQASFNFMAAITICSDFQYSLVAQSCPTLCDPMNRSTPGFPVHHQLLEFMQTHFQPSHSLSSPSPLAHNPSQQLSLFQWVNSLHEVAKVLVSVTPFLVGFLCSPRDSQESSPTPQFKSINSSMLNFLHSPTLVSIHDHWKNYSLD